MEDNIKDNVTGVSVKTNDKPFIMKVLIIACAFMLILLFSVFNHTKSVETKYKRERSEFIKEKMSLKDELDSLKSELKMNGEKIDSLKADKASISEELAQVKKSIVELETATSLEKESLIKSNEQLKKSGGAFQGYTTAQIIKEVSARETNENIKKFLADVALKLDMIMEGKVVALEPIVVTETENREANKEADKIEAKQGEIISFDKKTGLIVINIGREDNVREGQKLTIYNNQDAICTASVIRLRYQISAAVIETYRVKHSISDVREGLRVVRDQ